VATDVSAFTEIGSRTDWPPALKLIGVFVPAALVASRLERPTVQGPVAAALVIVIGKVSTSPLRNVVLFVPEMRQTVELLPHWIVLPAVVVAIPAVGEPRVKPGGTAIDHWNPAIPAVGVASTKLTDRLIVEPW
jgi:hypothetical protein